MILKTPIMELSMMIEHLKLRLEILENLKEYLQEFLHLNPDDELYISMFNKIESECEHLDSQILDIHFKFTGLL